VSSVPASPYKNMLAERMRNVGKIDGFNTFPYMRCAQRGGNADGESKTRRALRSGFDRSPVG